MAFEKDMSVAQERAKKIKIFAHDIHGVLTTNTVYCDVEGNRRYAFWHMDGFGDLSLMANDIKPVFLDSTSMDGEGLFRAKELKLDVPRFTKDLDTMRHEKEIDRDAKLGEALDLYNTPTIFINGVKLLGDRPLEAYKAVIDRELKAVGPGGEKR